MNIAVDIKPITDDVMTALMASDKPRNIVRTLGLTVKMLETIKSQLPEAQEIVNELLEAARKNEYIPPHVGRNDD